jgi:hypothetical protein
MDPPLSSTASMSQMPGAARAYGGAPPHSRRVGLLRPQLLQELLCGRPIGLGGIAGLTAGDHIALDAPPATRERDHMIHGQILGGKGAVAVCTDPVGNAIPPPLRLAQRLRFPFFAGDMPRIFGDVNPVSHVTSLFSS